jgi:hypothetical protein
VPPPDAVGAGVTTSRAMAAGEVFAEPVAVGALSVAVRATAAGDVFAPPVTDVGAVRTAERAMAVGDVVPPPVTDVGAVVTADRATAEGVAVPSPLPAPPVAVAAGVVAAKAIAAGVAVPSTLAGRATVIIAFVVLNAPCENVGAPIDPADAHSPSATISPPPLPVIDPSSTRSVTDDRFPAADGENAAPLASLGRVTPIATKQFALVVVTFAAVGAVDDAGVFVAVAFTNADTAMVGSTPR